MSRSSQNTEATQARIEALSHELRLMIAMVLSVRPASSGEIAEELGEPADKIRYQLRKLRDAGLVAVSEERHRRGVVERIYVACADKMDFRFEEVLSVPLEVRSRLALTLLRVIFRTSLHSLSQGELVGEERTLLSLVPMRVDLRGWEELTQLHRDMLDRTLQLKAESDLRLEASGDPSISAASALLWLRNPPRD
ncbi:MAG TPA: winged helix-turn-helix domain-containing protein [Solirubrobacterales bacterium]|nr:winged helix-turn-helix domain-containing protein [Solirubrobacterales bacterium]